MSYCTTMRGQGFFYALTKEQNVEVEEKTSREELKLKIGHWEGLIFNSAKRHHVDIGAKGHCIKRGLSGHMIKYINYHKMQRIK